MAIAKDLPETYLCETDADRNRIDCYAGQKCIMVNGDIYICITKGVWRKIGDELCAAIYTVEGETYLSQVYTKGESINAPDDPTIPDGTFNGWKVGEDLVEFPYTLNTDTTFIADITVTPPTPPEPTVTDLPYTFSISDFTEYSLGENNYDAFYIKAGRINLSTEKQYVMTLAVGGQNYSTVSRSVEEIGGTESAIEADFVFFDIPQEIDNALGSVGVLDGVYANMTEMDMREDNDFTVMLHINEGHRLSELSSIEGITISEYTE